MSHSRRSGTPIRVAVDLLYFTGRKGGTETYAKGLFGALPAVAPDLQFVGITNSELGTSAPDWFPGPVVVLPVSGEHRLQWAAAEIVPVALTARRIGADLLHCPANFGPVVRLLPTVVTIHDLLSFRHPHLIPGRLAKGVSVLSHRAGRTATRVLTDSRASAADIVAFLGLPPERIDVVPLAGSTPGRPSEQPDALSHLGVSSNRRFVLSTGNRMPHKNFEALLRAWALLPSTRPQLVLTGSHDDDPLRPLVSDLGLDDDVALCGWVTSIDLETLYRRAALYVCPSLFEGFGLPVLEALQRGCPVLAADIPVLHEIGGSAARYVDPGSPDTLAAGIRSALEAPADRAMRRSAGQEQAARFTWEKAAVATADTYRRAAHSGSQ